MTDGDRTSVAEREASAITTLSGRVLANQLEIVRVTGLAVLALRIARRGRIAIPLWVIACLLLVLVLEGAVYLTHLR